MRGNPAEPAPSTEAPSHGGKAVALVMLAILVAITLFTYFVVPSFVTPYYREKPAQTRRLFDALEASLLRYHADHAAFPPEDELNRYRRHNQNLIKSRSFGITTYRLAALTTPTAYIQPDQWGDPYAMPEQFAPPGYATGQLTETAEHYAVIFSPGPDLVYDIRPIEIHGLATRQQLEQYLAQRRLDPQRPRQHKRDFYRVLITTPDSRIDTIDAVTLP